MVSEGERMSDDAMSLERARAAVVAGVRSRHAQLERAIYEQVSARVPELMVDGDAEGRARAMIAAMVKYCLDAIERGPRGTREIPGAALERARVAAREGASVGLLLRAFQAGYQPFVALLIAEAEGLPDSATVREHLRETYGGLLGDLAAAVEREYNQERERVAPSSAADRNGTPPALTGTERRVLELVRGGLVDKQVADVLSVSPHTVHAHMKSIFRKLEVHSRQELVGRWESS